MVSEKKKQEVKQAVAYIKEHPLIGIINMHKLPAKQLLEIRNKLKGEAKIRVFKKRLIGIALKECGIKGLDKLADYLQGEPSLLFSKSEPFKLSRIISQSKSLALAKAGDIAPRDIIVTAGPTNLAAGPVIGELQRVKIPVVVQGEKLAVKQDVVVAKEGDVISKNLADILTKLGIEPMEIGLDLVAVWNKGLIYERELLFIPLEKYLDDVRQAYSSAFNLTLNIGYPTKENLPFLLSKAHKEAIALALAANIPTKHTVRHLVHKAHTHAKAVKGRIKE